MSDSILPYLAVAQADDESGLFAFYGRLHTLRNHHKAIIVPAVPPELHPASTRPLLRWEHLGIGNPTFFTWLTQVGQLWEEQDPGALDELEALTATASLQAGEAWYTSGSANMGSVIDALLANAIAPYLEVAADAAKADYPDQWRKPYCAVCGGWPDMARYDEKKSRYRCICERCSTEWAIVRDACLFCGESNEERRGFYSSEDDLHRVMVCDNCGYYLKVVNDAVARRMGYSFVLAAERLITPGLDLTAVQEGYTRPVWLSDNH